MIWGSPAYVATKGFLIYMSVEPPKFWLILQAYGICVYGVRFRNSSTLSQIPPEPPRSTWLISQLEAAGVHQRLIELDRP
jgi:hypothetical protein